MSALVSILLTVLIFGVLIFVHEFGHFAAARLFKVKVNEFAIGMGPKIFSHKSEKSGTLYSVRLFPVGGYNSMEGEDDDSSVEGAFCSKPAWQRMIIIVAGAAMNILTGIILMLVIVLSTKHIVSTQVDVFTGKDEQGQHLTEYQGLKSGDIILEIDGKKVHVANEVTYQIFNRGTKPVDIKVIRDSKEIVLENIQFEVAKSGNFTYGVRNFYMIPEAKTFGNIIKQTFYGCKNTIVQVFDSLGGLITGKYGITDLSGPIGVGGEIGKAAKMGIDAVLNLTVVLAMNLGIFNVLPIPALDGGRLVFLIIEAIRGKPVPRNIEANIHGAGMLVLFGLIIVVAFKDLFMLF